MVAQVVKIFHTIYWKYSILQNSWEYHSRLSQGMNSQNPSWYSSLKSTAILSSYINTQLLNELFPPYFPINNMFKIIFIPMHATFLTHCHCSLIPHYLTSSTNYETPHYASFSSQFLCIQFKHYSHHSVLKQPAYKWQKALPNITRTLCY